jgi:hypothetical protein
LRSQGGPAAAAAVSSRAVPDAVTCRRMTPPSVRTLARRSLPHPLCHRLYRQRKVAASIQRHTLSERLRITLPLRSVPRR